jgi:hypothetical protein
MSVQYVVKLEVPPSPDKSEFDSAASPKSNGRKFSWDSTLTVASDPFFEIPGDIVTESVGLGSWSKRSS